MTSLKLFIADQDRQVVSSFSQLIAEKEGWQLVGSAKGEQEAFAAIKKLKPDLLLLDMALLSDGALFVSQLKNEVPTTKILVFSNDATEQAMLRAIEAGADGYSLKNISRHQLIKAIEVVSQGKCWIEPQIEQQLAKSPGART